MKNIKVKAVCILTHNNRILVADGKTLKGMPGKRTIVPGTFYRLMGGSINFGEKAEDAVRREVWEELNTEITNLKYLKTEEAIYTYAGEQGHTIYFIFTGEVARTELTKQEAIHITEDDYEFDAKWVPFEEITKGNQPLVPETNYYDILNLN